MLRFGPFEKSLFGYPRSWAAAAGDGHYVIEKAPTGDLYQSRWQDAEGRREPLMSGAWQQTFDRAKQLCEADANRRQRQRIIDKARQRG